jgi:hypothetical protein
MDEESRWNVLMRANHGGLNGHGAEWTLDTILDAFFGPAWGWPFAVGLYGLWVEAFS